MPNRKQREKASSGYTSVPGFSRQYVVNEGDGSPNLALSVAIEDAGIREKIYAKYYKSLQLHGLGVQLNESYFQGDSVHIPYAVSVKHTQGDAKLNGDKGTIEVGGELVVRTEGSKLIVTVVRFDDSWFLERDGRKLGFNEGIDLNFARAVAKPVLELWFNSEPARIQTLLDLLQTVKVPRRP